MLHAAASTRHQVKDFDLIFYIDPAGEWGRWPCGGPTDLRMPTSLDELDIPTQAGAYVLGTTDGQRLTYPWGESSVYYIGKADSLFRRLSEHRKAVDECAADCWTYYWRTRYQYGASHGMSAAWYATQDDETPAVLESDLLERFYCRFGTIPIGNDRWDWGRLKRMAEVSE